jgi:hypothetical protein
LLKLLRWLEQQTRHQVKILRVGHSVAQYYALGKTTQRAASGSITVYCTIFAAVRTYYIFQIIFYVTVQECEMGIIAPSYIGHIRLMPPQVIQSSLAAKVRPVFMW